MDSGRNWYLLRTRAGKEHTAESQVSRLTGDVLLPLLRVRVHRSNRMVASVAPLFPCYLFARFDFELECARLRYTRGLQGVVCFGDQPAIVPEWLITELKQRCEQGPVELPEPRLLRGAPVLVVDGPFRDFEGVFERHLPGTQRVAILLRTMGREVRSELSATMVVPVDGQRPVSVEGNTRIQQHLRFERNESAVVVS
jgi:transcriptional antiterminator RfaH